MRYLWSQTGNEKTGTIDGVNLFFGALLGTNLGTLDHLALNDYAVFTLLLAGTVMTLRMVSTSERRLYALATLALYAVLLGAIVTLPRLQPKGLAQGDLHRLVVTIAVWMASIVFLELFPVRPANQAALPGGAGDE